MKLFFWIYFAGCIASEEQNAPNIDDPDTLVVMATNEELQSVNSAQNVTVAENSNNVTEDGTDVISTKVGSQDGNHSNIGNHGNNTSDDDDDFDDDDYEDDIDYTDTARRTHHPDRKQKHQAAISVPVLLNLLKIDLDLIQLTRVLFSQAVRYHSNSLARNAIQDNKFTDLSATGMITEGFDLS